MKRLITAVSVLSLGSLPLMADNKDVQKSTEISKNADGSVTKTETKMTTFDPQVRTKVVKYFDTYKTNPHGLPPAWATKVRVKEVPAAWKTTIAPGYVIEDTYRTHLVEAPSDLISVLPTAPSGVRYYVAGSNVIAVDSGYRVVDSIPIPSIKIDIDD
jgi:hypothetical protein